MMNSMTSHQDAIYTGNMLVPNATKTFTLMVFLIVMDVIHLNVLKSVNKSFRWKNFFFTIIII